MVYVFLANGFEEIEAITIIDVLRRGNVDVRTVGIGSKTVTGTHGVQVEADLADREASASAAEMIVLPGGQPGTDNLGKSEIVTNMIRDFAATGKRIAAICAAPTVLGHVGVLSGRMAVCYPGCEGALKGAKIGAENVVCDGNIVTSKGPGTAMEFSLTLLKILKGENAAAEVAAGMLLS